MLKLSIHKYYKVKEGQSLKTIAEAFSVSIYSLVRENDLREEVFVGQILKIPSTRGNAYTASPSDTKTLLCGSDENFKRRNGGVGVVYPGMRVIL